MRSFTDISSITLTPAEKTALRSAVAKGESGALFISLVAGAAVSILAIIIAAVVMDERSGNPVLAAAFAGIITSIIVCRTLTGNITPEERALGRWAADFEARVALYNERVSALALWQQHAAIDDRPDVSYWSTANARREELASELRALMRHDLKADTRARTRIDLYV